MKQHILKLLSYSILFLLLFSCKKKDNFLPLKTGKYHVEYTKVHSNGTIEYSEYTAFGQKWRMGNMDSI